jgi:hypothetical protein
METNLEKAKRLIKAHAAIQGIHLPDNAYIFEMLELAALPNAVNNHFIKTDVSGSLPLPVKLICKNCGDWYGIDINHKCYKCLQENFVQR